MHEGVTGSSLLRVNVPGFRAALSLAIGARARKAISRCHLIKALVAKHVGLASVTKCCPPLQSPFMCYCFTYVIGTREMDGSG